jgi:hypothetical protein
VDTGERWRVGRHALDERLDVGPANGRKPTPWTTPVTRIRRRTTLSAAATTVIG